MYPGPSDRSDTIPRVTMTVPSAIPTVTPARANRYHRSPTRHSTNRRSKRPMPALPSIAPVMMNADRNGPSRMPTGTTKPFMRGLLYGRRPAPSSERNHGLHAIQEKAKAMMKKEVSGCRASRPCRGEADRSEASAVGMLLLLSLGLSLASLYLL